MKVYNVDVHKMTSEEKAALIKEYTGAGWIYNGSWDLSIHQWLSFIWPNDDEPKEV